MPIEVKQSHVAITGKGIDLYRLLTLKMGLRAELHGMRLTRGVNCFAMVKKEFGLKGRDKQKIYEEFCKIVEIENAKVVRVYDDRTKDAELVSATSDENCPKG